MGLPPWSCRQHLVSGLPPMIGVLQATAFALLVGFAVLGALEVDRRLAGCSYGLHFAGAAP